MRTFSKKIAAVAIGSTVALTASGVAFAFWTGSGSGSGSASTGTGSSSLAAAQTGVLTAIVPGGTAQTLSGTVTNNGSETTYVTKVTASIASVTGACDASDYVLANPVMTVGSDLAATASANFSGATIAFNNKATNQDGCKGATVSISYTVS